MTKFLQKIVGDKFSKFHTVSCGLIFLTVFGKYFVKSIFVLYNCSNHFHEIFCQVLKDPSPQMVNKNSVKSTFARINHAATILLDFTKHFSIAWVFKIEWYWYAMSQLNSEILKCWLALHFYGMICWIQSYGQNCLNNVITFFPRKRVKYY